MDSTSDKRYADVVKWLQKTRELAGKEVCGRIGVLDTTTHEGTRDIGELHLWTKVVRDVDVLLNSIQKLRELL